MTLAIGHEPTPVWVVVNIVSHYCVDTINVIFSDIQVREQLVELSK